MSRRGPRLRIRGAWELPVSPGRPPNGPIPPVNGQARRKRSDTRSVSKKQKLLQLRRLRASARALREARPGRPTGTNLLKLLENRLDVFVPPFRPHRARRPSLVNHGRVTVNGRVTDIAFSATLAM